MARSKKLNQQNSKEEPASRRKEKPELKNSAAQPDRERPSISPFEETPFQPSTTSHIEMLAGSPSIQGKSELLLALQQTYGNKYVQRLMSEAGVQAGLTVSQPEDTSEQEADRISRAVSTGNQVSPAGSVRPALSSKVGRETRVVQREMSAPDLNTLGISAEHFNKFSFGDKRYIENLYRGGHVEAAKEQARKAVEARRGSGSTGTAVLPPGPPGNPPVPNIPKPVPLPPGRAALPVSGPGNKQPVPPGNIEQPRAPAPKAPLETIPIKEPDKSPGPEAYDGLVQQATFITASAGGTGGIFFLHPKEGEAPKVVVKFEPGEASRGKFAETLLLAGGFNVTRSLAYPVTSSKGKRIKNKIQELINNPQSCPRDPARKRRLDMVAGKIGQGQAALVSDFIPALGTLAEIMSYEPGKEKEGAQNIPEKALIEAFNNVENAVMLGKLLVFDAMLGNQDRLDAMNLANVMLAQRGGKWTFVLIDNDVEIPTMLGELAPRLKVKAENSGLGRTQVVKEKVTVKQWVKKLIEGGQGIEKLTAGIDFIGNAGGSSADLVEKLKSKYLEPKGMEKVAQAINLGQLQRGIRHGINQGANAILNITPKELKKMLEKETKSLGKSEYLNAYGLELKQHYIQLVFEQKKTHQDAMAEIEQMASKKMKELTGSAEMVYTDAGIYEQKGKIKVK